MTFATQLTLIRLLLVGPILFFLSAGSMNNTLLAMALFWIALTTDWLDGSIARKLGQVSDLGGVLDALFDKLLIYSLVAGLYRCGIYNSVVAIAAFSRDVSVEAIRGYSALHGKALPANCWGKLKFVLQSFSVTCGFLALLWPQGVGAAFIWGANVFLATALIVSLPGLLVLARTALGEVPRSAVARLESRPSSGT